MKKLISTILIFIPLLNQAVTISHEVIDGVEIGHQFEVTDPDEPYYADADGAYPEEGYSYFWHTDEGHVSNVEKPIFFFSSAGPHNVHLTLTPRKKGDDELKVFAVYNFDVISGDESTASHGNITDVDMYIDGEARIGDKIYVVVPLNPCQSIGTNHKYKVGYDHTKLRYSNLLPQSNLDDMGTLPLDDDAFGIPLYKTVNFRYDWSTFRDDIAVVIEFEVLAHAKMPIALKFHHASKAPCDKDVEIMFSPIAGPYDPNYKESNISKVNVAAHPEKKVNTTEVLYTIHFQNIGEAPVDSVTIFDTLPNYLTFSSFEGSSEPGSIVSTSYSGGTLKWIIAPNADIKGTNQSPAQPEPDTKGWVRFRAEISKEEDIVYDICYCLRNIATIYFDTLDPISTAADIITIGDSLCFSPNSQGELYAQTICDSTLSSSTPPSSMRLKPNGKKGKVSYTVYPNPSNDAFHLKGDLEKIQGIEVLNSLGQRVFPLSKYKRSISLGNQPRGLYFIRIKTEGGQQLVRIEKH